MEELRSTEILDKEIQEDARKKADKIVKNSQKEAQNIIDSVSGRIETAKQEKEKLYAEKLTRFERDTNASLPLEKQRFLVSFEDEQVTNGIKNYLEKLFSWKDKHVIKVITGSRRSGTSVILKEFCKEIVKSVSIEQITFFNFEMLENEELQDYHFLYNVLKNRLVKDKMNYIFLDEIQNIPEFQKTVDGLFILKNCDIYING